MHGAAGIDIYPKAKRTHYCIFYIRYPETESINNVLLKLSSTHTITAIDWGIGYDIYTNRHALQNSMLYKRIVDRKHKRYHQVCSRNAWLRPRSYSWPGLAASLQIGTSQRVKTPLAQSRKKRCVNTTNPPDVKDRSGQRKKTTALQLWRTPTELIMLNRRPLQ